MAALAQLVEHRIVAPVVTGSIPVCRPKFPTTILSDSMVETKKPAQRGLFRIRRLGFSLSNIKPKIYFCHQNGAMWVLSNTHRRRFLSRGIQVIPVFSHIRKYVLATCACALLAGVVWAEDTTAGYAVLIGGGLKADNEAVWNRLVGLAGGRGARFVVFGTAAGDPEGAAGQIVEALQKYGAIAEAIPAAPELKDTDTAFAVRDPILIAKTRAARGVFFAGGAQGRIKDTLAPGGKNTPLLDAIWDVYRKGGVVAGTSAGAAIMSRIMFRDGRDIMKILKGELRDGVEMDQGLGFVGPSLFVDQHFLRRGRIGRMLPLMLAKNYRVGLGVDENSAAVVHDDEIEVLGGTGALLVDLSDAASNPELRVFNLHNARLSYLDDGDRYDLRTRALTPSAEKLAGRRVDPNAANFSPYYQGEKFYIDILSDTTIVTAMRHLLSSDRQTLKGLAFNPTPVTNDSQPDLGFEFQLRKGTDSLGWYAGGPGGAGYTIANIYLDVSPVRVRQPLYTSWQP